MGANLPLLKLLPLVLIKVGKSANSTHNISKRHVVSLPVLSSIYRCSVRSSVLPLFSSLFPNFCYFQSVGKGRRLLPLLFGRRSQPSDRHRTNRRCASAKRKSTMAIHVGDLRGLHDTILHLWIAHRVVLLSCQTLANCTFFECNEMLLLIALKFFKPAPKDTIPNARVTYAGASFLFNRHPRCRRRLLAHSRIAHSR